MLKGESTFIADGDNQRSYRHLKPLQCLLLHKDFPMPDFLIFELINSYKKALIGRT